MSDRKRFMLDVRMKFDEPMVGEAAITTVAQALARAAPAWSVGAVIWESPRRKLSIDLDEPGALFAAISAHHVQSVPRQQALSERFGFGQPELFAELVEIRGSSNALTVVLHVDERIIHPVGDAWQWGNGLSLQIRQANIEGQPAASWAIRTLLGICEHSPVAYASAYLVDEFYEANLDSSQGARVIGMDISKSIAGMYWANYFGRPYVALIGLERLEKAPAWSVERIGSGVFVQLSQDPRAWTTEGYRQSRDIAMDIIGREYFFDRGAPHRRTRGIDISPYLRRSAWQGPEATPTPQW